MLAYGNLNILNCEHVNMGTWELVN